MDFKNFKYSFFIRPSIRMANEKKGVPVYVRVIINGEKKDFSSKVFGDKKLWLNGLKRFNGNDEQSKRTNRHLDDLTRRLEQIYWELQNEPEEISIKRYFEKLNGNSKVLLFLDVFQKRLDEIIALEGTSYAKSTITTYKVTLKHLKCYLEKKDLTKIELKNFNRGLVRGFFEFLRMSMSNNSANKNMRKLRAVMSYAMENEWINANPFLGFKIKDEKRTRQALDIDEINRITNKVIPNKRLSTIRDIFLFQCYTGLAFIDIKDLKIEHLITENRNDYIVKERGKDRS